MAASLSSIWGFPFISGSLLHSLWSVLHKAVSPIAGNLSFMAGSFTSIAGSYSSMAGCLSFFNCMDFYLHLVVSHPWLAASSPWQAVPFNTKNFSFYVGISTIRDHFGTVCLSVLYHDPSHYLSHLVSMGMFGVFLTCTMMFTIV